MAHWTLEDTPKTVLAYYVVGTITKLDARSRDAHQTNYLVTPNPGVYFNPDDELYYDAEGTGKVYRVVKSNLWTPKRLIDFN